MSKFLIRSTIVLLAVISTLAHANVDNIEDPPKADPSRATVELENDPFDNLDTAKMDLTKDYYNQNIAPFSQWQQDRAADAAVLNLYPGFKERMIVDKTTGENVLEDLMIFEARAKLIINKSANKIDFPSMIKPEFINQMDPNISNEVIHSAATMPNVAGHGTISNFAWCNERAKGNFISAPMAETDLSQMVDPSHQWCSDNTRSTCVESCYIYDGAIQFALIHIVNELVHPPKDIGQATQSEIRYFVDQKELGLKVPLESLTHIKTPVRGGLVQNMFYSNQLAKFSKVIAIVQDHPTNPNASVVTILFASAIKRHTWDESLKLVKGSDLVMGTAYLHISKLKIKKLNTEACVVTDGLPRFTQCTVSRFADILGK